MPVMALVFHPDTHTYELDGRSLVSVTRVLRDVVPIEGVWFMDDAARVRGTRVHEACNRIDEGLAVTDPALEPYLRAYTQFRTDLAPVWSHRESPVFDEPMGYAGTLDRAGWLGGTRYVLDIKTGAIPATVGLQTAAYRRCLLTPHEYERAALQLRADGTYRLEHLRERSDEAVFLAALLVWQWRQRHRVPSDGC